MSSTTFSGFLCAYYLQRVNFVYLKSHENSWRVARARFSIDEVDEHLWNLMPVAVSHSMAWPTCEVHGDVDNTLNSVISFCGASMIFSFLDDLGTKRAHFPPCTTDWRATHSKKKIQNIELWQSSKDTIPKMLLWGLRQRQSTMYWKCQTPQKSQRPEKGMFSSTGHQSWPRCSPKLSQVCVSAGCGWLCQLVTLNLVWSWKRGSDFTLKSDCFREPCLHDSKEDSFPFL